MRLKEIRKSEYLMIKYICLIKHMNSYHSKIVYESNANDLLVIKYNGKVFHGFPNSHNDGKIYDLIKGQFPLKRDLLICSSCS